MTPLVSIIVPIYNAQEKIGRCIESILNQTYKDFELILLDDGSTDESGSICDAYAKKDDRIIVVHKENSGVSDTRNLGISMAKGEYLQFLDSDDWITPDATTLFVRAAVEHNCDMVIADFYRVIGERVSQKGAIEEDGLMDRTAFAEIMMQRPADFYYGVLWNKFYKRSVIEEYQIKMDSSVSWCEDFMFNLEYIRHIQTVYALKVPIYYYVKTKDSLVSQGMSMKKTIQMKRMVFSYYNDFYKDVFGEVDYEKRRIQVYRFLFDAAGDGAVSPLILPGNYRLGSERTQVSEGVQEGEGFFFDVYREQKLQESFLDAVALRNDLLTVDVKVLYYLSQPHENCTFKEMAKILNISRSALSLSIQRLLTKGFIEARELEKEEMKEKKKKKEKREKSSEESLNHKTREYVTTLEAEPVLTERMFVLHEFDQVQYEGFSEEEILLYEKLNERRNQNIKKALK
ncbi:MAG: glycosyltransferase [Lachnospiraceae bacterium]|nr:glycosyltransferase [Lachnospiraceae bacterium]